MEKITNPNYVKLQSKSSLGPKTSLKKALPQCPHVCLCLFSPQCLFPFVIIVLSSCEVVLWALLHTSSCWISSFII